MTKITKDMIIIDVINMDPNCAEVFFANGLHCVGCPSASGESIVDAAAVHGINSDKLIAELNEYFSK